MRVSRLIPAAVLSRYERVDSRRRHAIKFRILISADEEFILDGNLHVSMLTLRNQ